jgi:hypothetical protein
MVGTTGGIKGGMVNTAIGAPIRTTSITTTGIGTRIRGTTTGRGTLRFSLSTTECK